MLYRKYGGEGGIRTHDPDSSEYRFSRAAPSTTRPPLPFPIIARKFRSNASEGKGTLHFLDRYDKNCIEKRRSTCYTLRFIALLLTCSSHSHIMNERSFVTSYSVYPALSTYLSFLFLWRSGGYFLLYGILW